jgi:glutathione S-transferase
MSDDLVFFTNPNSRGGIVRWMLEETGAPYVTQVVAYGAYMSSPEYRAINPMRKVPAIRHKGHVVTEAAAICAYLADAFPDAGLAPALNARAFYYRWLFFAAGPLEAAVINTALGFAAPEGKSRMIGYGDFERTLDTLEGAVTANPYVAGEMLTAADVYIGSQIGAGLMFNSLPARPAFQAYWARLMERPALVAGRAKDGVLRAELAKT